MLQMQETKCACHMLEKDKICLEILGENKTTPVIDYIFPHK